MQPCIFFSLLYAPIMIEIKKTEISTEGMTPIEMILKMSKFNLKGDICYITSKCGKTVMIVEKRTIIPE